MRHGLVILACPNAESEAAGRTPDTVDRGNTLDHDRAIHTLYRTFDGIWDWQLAECWCRHALKIQAVYSGGKEFQTWDQFLEWRAHQSTLVFSRE